LTQLYVQGWVRIGIGMLAVAALALATLAPVASARGRSEATGLYLALAPLCHQRADRSWRFQDFPAGLCVRCYGIYSGIAAAALLGLPFSRRVASAGFLVLGAAWAAEHLGGFYLPDMVRFASGGGLGGAMAAAISARKPR
jgi:hypothetical protein